MVFKLVPQLQTMSQMQYIDDEIKRFLNQIKQLPVCAEIEYVRDVCTVSQTVALRKGYTECDLACFYDTLHIEYSRNTDMQNVFGTIWFADGSWATRQVYDDGFEQWAWISRPPTPSQCAFVDAIEDEDTQQYDFE